MSNTFVLAARLRATKLRGIYVHVDHLTAEAADALTAQAATIAEQAREFVALKLERDNAEGMAECMAMFRTDMIEAGVITEAVAPMFMTEAIFSKLSALRADAERYRWLREHGMYKAPKVAVKDGYGGKELATGSDLDSAIDAAMQSGKAAQPHDNRKCSRPKCNGNMRPGTYLEQTFSGVPDFPGDRHAVTVSPSGLGRLAECLKCDACGHSVTAGKAVQG